MRIAFYTPFKPLSHPKPSGDLTIATGIRDFLTARGHIVEPMSRLRTRWIYAKPWLWAYALWEIIRLRKHRYPPSLWLTYHTYYKAPDVIGPYVSTKLKIPYVIFQGIYSTKRRKDWRTWPGFHLNLLALHAASHIFTNKKEDLINLRRLIPNHCLTYVAPGIFPGDFYHDPLSRDKLRNRWGVGNEPVILSAAMFRPGVKTDGLSLVIRVCRSLAEQGRNFKLVIAGEGKTSEYLKHEAHMLPQTQVLFTGYVPRSEMYQYYSAADVFAFPGIRESLGMVYLEAQSCGLPVVAYDNGGVPEVVSRDETGLLVPFGDETSFALAIRSLLESPELRGKMGLAAGRYVRRYHDANINYSRMESILKKIQQNHSKGMGR